MFLGGLHDPVRSAGCPSSHKWLAYNGAHRDLECDSSLDQWWKRDTRQGSAGCPLQEEDWVQDCSSSQTCSVRVTSTTTALEYCCTNGDNPATTDERRCFNLDGKFLALTRDCVRQYRLILPVCPKITSLAVPSKVISGTTVTIYLTVAAYPVSSFHHPTLEYWNTSGPSTTISPQISTHTEFINRTIAYSFIVPSEGIVDLRLDGITPPHGSGCQSAFGDFKNHYEMTIVPGMLGERCVCMCGTPRDRRKCLVQTCRQ